MVVIVLKIREGEECGGGGIVSRGDEERRVFRVTSARERSIGGRVLVGDNMTELNGGLREGV